MKSRILKISCAGISVLVVVAVLNIGLWNTSVVAEPATLAQPVAASGTGSRNGAVRINNSGATTWDEARSLGRMQENVRLTQDGEDFILYCEELLYNRNTNQAIAKGKLRVESRDSTITGNEIRANFNTKMIVVLGNVVMKSHGSEDGIKGSDPKKNNEKRSLREEVKGKASRMTCDRIDYNYENRQALIVGNINMVQEKNSGTCERIVFDEDRNIAQLISGSPYGVKFTDGEARTILTREVVVYIDDDHVETKYPVKIDIPRPRGTPAPPQPKATFAPLTKIPENPFAEEPAPIPPVAPTENTAPEAPADKAADKPAAEKGQ